MAATVRPAASYWLVVADCRSDRGRVVGQNRLDLPPGRIVLEFGAVVAFVDLGRHVARRVVLGPLPWIVRNVAGRVVGKIVSVLRPRAS